MKLKTAYADRRSRRKHRREQRPEDDHTHCKCIATPFFRSVEVVSYEKRLARLVPKLLSDGFTSTAAKLDF